MSNSMTLGDNPTPGGHGHHGEHGDLGVRPGEIAVGVIIGRVGEFFDFFVYGIASVLVFPGLFFPFTENVFVSEDLMQDNNRTNTASGGFLSLLPVGLAQTWASVEHGMWYARSAEFLQTPLLETLRWLRAPGDTIFAVGMLAMGWFVVGLSTGW